MGRCDRRTEKIAQAQRSTGGGGIARSSVLCQICTVASKLRGNSETAKAAASQARFRSPFADLDISWAATSLHTACCMLNADRSTPSSPRSSQRILLHPARPHYRRLHFWQNLQSIVLKRAKSMNTYDTLINAFPDDASQSHLSQHLIEPSSQFARTNSPN